MGKAEVLWSLWALLSSQGLNGTFGIWTLLVPSEGRDSSSPHSWGSSAALFCTQSSSTALFIGKALLGQCVVENTKMPQPFPSLGF